MTTDHHDSTEEQRLMARLARALARAKKAEHELGSALLERDSAIRDFVAQSGRGSGAKLARLTGLTRMRIHQIANPKD